MNCYEKQYQEPKKVFYPFLLAILVLAFLIFFCIVEKNYEALALTIGVILIGFFRIGGGIMLYCHEKRKDNP